MPTDSATIDSYIAQFPPDVQVILKKLRQLVADAAPEATEAMKYGIPTFVLNGNLVHFAAFAKHIGLYPTPSAIEHFRDALTGYHSAKGSIQFPLSEPIPYKLIRQIVDFRVGENRAKATTKSKPKTSKKPKAAKARRKKSSPQK